MASPSAELREALRRLFRKVGFYERDEARCCSMSLSRCQVLVEIGRSGGLSLVDLAARMGLEKSSVSRLVDGLVEDGLVERRESPLDRRYLVIGLTPEGKARFLDIEERMEAFMGQVWERLPEERRTAVLESLQILEEALGGCETDCERGKRCDGRDPENRRKEVRRSHSKGIVLRREFKRRLLLGPGREGCRYGGHLRGGGS